MPAGIRDLRQIEIGFQGLGTGDVCDTPATPDARIVGTCGMKKTPTLVFPEEATGLMSDHIINRAYEPWVMAELVLAPETEGLTYEQIVWYLTMGARGGVGGSGVGLDKLWRFTPDLVNGDMPGVASIRYGDNVEVWNADCCFARELTISSAFQAPWQISADVIGRNMVTSAFEGKAYPTDVASWGPLHTILGQLTSFYLEDTCAACFDDPTAKGITLIDWTVTVPGFHAKFFQDGVLYYTAIGLASRHLTLEATIEFNAAVALGEHANWITRTPRYMRIEALGDALGGSFHRATIDMVLMYESFDTLDQRDGNDIVRFVARTVYDVECTATVPEWEITIVNAFATLP